MNQGRVKIAEELALASKRAYTRGIQTGSGGNVSSRIPGEDRMLVKASGGSLGDCDKESFLVTDFEGNIIEGNGKPTREALLHGLIYKLCPNVNAIVHVHSPYAISWSYGESFLPRVTWHSKLKINVNVPVLNVPAAMVREEDFPLVIKMFEENTYPDLKAFILEAHGVVAMGKDAIEAEHNAELVEETAQISVLKKIMGKQ